jgi:nicotinate-nucleotide adenylyltransferase
MKQKKVGLYFGTFNPIHVGHLIIANYIVDYTDVDEVWLIVSPQNPLKRKSSLLADHHRLQLARVAVDDNPKIIVSNVEFDLPQPSFTINTMAHLEEKYPSHDFSLIMGEDNLRTIHKWKNYEELLSRYEFFVYPRVLLPGETVSENDKLNAELLAKVHLIEAPVMTISASYIRNAIREGHSVKYLLTEAVEKYILEMHFYES